MTFIFLHDEFDDEIIVNADNVNYFQLDSNKKTLVEFTNREDVYVNETPSEIMELIRNADNPPSGKLRKL
ncbi:MAG: hypothetical protein K2G36_10600 [Ruminococcus sp.]|nr:hypothetical protein [Ruminococcus sp.]